MAAAGLERLQTECRQKAARLLTKAGRGASEGAVRALYSAAESVISKARSALQTAAVNAARCNNRKFSLESHMRNEERTLPALHVWDADVAMQRRLRSGQ